MLGQLEIKRRNAVNCEGSFPNPNPQAAAGRHHYHALQGLSIDFEQPRL